MDNSKDKLILVTGGHLTPAVAVISELKKRSYDKFIWVGHKKNQHGNKEVSPEFTTINNLEIAFIDLKTGKLNRRWTLGTFFSGIKNLILIFIGIIQSFYIILKYKPALILSFGGYLAVPIVIVGKLFGRRVITHEQTITTGLANRIVSKFADKVLISWESSKKYFDQTKTVLTGNPIRREIFVIKSDTLSKEIDSNYPTLLIYGGNQGSHEINKRVFAILPELIKECNIIHQTGNSTVTQDNATAQKIKNDLPEEIRSRYIIRDYILQDEVGEALNKADLIFSRSGANSISEILALGKLSILMPIPWSSHNEQVLNANFVVETGLGYLINQSESLTPETVYQTILLGLNQLKTRKGFNGRSIDECREKAKSKIILDAPQRVSNEVEALLK